MKICIIGTGGVGAYFGGRMAEAGYDVTFVARGKHLKEIQKNGLKIKSVNGDMHIQAAKATERPGGRFDLIILAVKVWQIYALEDMLKAMMHEKTILLPIENGIEAPGILKQWVAAEHVLGGLCRIFSWIESPGIINHSAYDPSITFGELDNTLSDRVKAIAAIFDKSHIKNHIAQDIEQEMWRKFLFITSTSAMGALTRVPYGIFMNMPETRALLIEVLREMVEVGIAKGVNINHAFVDKTMQFADAMPDDATTSLQRDIMEGKPSELDAQMGAVVRLAKELNVKTRHCHFVYSSLLPQEKLARKEVNKKMAGR